MTDGSRLGSALRKPKILVPTLLAAALLATILSLADLGKVGEMLARLRVTTALGTLGIAAVYLVLKLLVFELLLRGLGIEAGWRDVVVAYAVGEMTLTLPAGIYAQNYLLQRMRGAQFGRSAAATTATLAIEAALAFGILLWVGVPGWAWLRPGIAAVCIVSALALLGVARVHGTHRLLESLARRPRLASLVGQLRDFGAGVRSLVGFRWLGPAVLLVGAYLAALTSAFWATAQGVGVTPLTPLQALSVYSFALACTLLLGGVLSQIGVVETAGVGAAQAWGYSLDQGLGMLLAFRILWLGSVWLLAGATLLMLGRRLRGMQLGSDAPGRCEGRR